MPSLIRQSCQSMSQDADGNEKINIGSVTEIGSTQGSISGQPKCYSILSGIGEGDSTSIKSLKGFVEPLDSSTTDDQALIDGIDTLIQVYLATGPSMSSNNEGLKAFVNFYCAKILIKTPPTSPTIGSIVQVDSFSCPVCYGIFIDPVTISCSHSYCRNCLKKEKAGNTCRRCSHVLGAKDITRNKVNVMIKNLVEKWWPDLVAANHLRNEGNTFFDDKFLDEAFAKYSQAIDLCSRIWNSEMVTGLLFLRDETPREYDHLSLANRAQTLLTLGRSEEALRDAEAAIKACSVWAKGHFRKAITLTSLGRYEEAFITITVCLYLVKATKINNETAVLPLKCELMKVLHKIFLQATVGGGATARRTSMDQAQFPYSTSVRRKPRRGHGDPVLGDEITNRGAFKSSTKIPSCRKTVRGQRSRGRENLNYGSIITAEQRIHRAFSRAVLETKRIKREVIERTKTVADQPHGSTSPSIRSSVLRRVDRSRIEISDFECTLCFRLLYQPMTTTCGHTFCKACLERSLDHSSSCALCKTQLQDATMHQKTCSTYFLEIAMQEFFRDEYVERAIQHQEELAEAAGSSLNKGLEIPIFVCTIAFPNVPCPLHIFEPRYRLMIRRSLESGTRRFGMCSYSQEGNNYADIGTIMEIKNVQYFADGRQVIETVGAERFKVVSRSQKDGYHMATVEIIQDSVIDPVDLQRVREKHDHVLTEAREWLKSINKVLGQRIRTHFGVMPEPEENWMELASGPAWCWWLVAILPLETKAQLAILSMNKLERRLDSILKVLKYVKSNNM